MSTHPLHSYRIDFSRHVLSHYSYFAHTPGQQGRVGPSRYRRTTSRLGAPVPRTQSHHGREGQAVLWWIPQCRVRNCTPDLFCGRTRYVLHATSCSVFSPTWRSPYSGPLAIVREVTVTVKKVTVQVIHDEDIDLSEIATQPDDAVMAAIEDMLSSDGESDDTSNLSPASSDPPANLFPLENHHGYRREHSIDQYFPRIPAAAIADVAGPITPPNMQPAHNTRTRIIRGGRPRSNSTGSFSRTPIICRSAPALYAIALHGPFGPRPRNVESVIDEDSLEDPFGPRPRNIETLVDEDLMDM